MVGKQSPQAGVEDSRSQPAVQALPDPEVCLQSRHRPSRIKRSPNVAQGSPHVDPMSLLSPKNKVTALGPSEVLFFCADIHVFACECVHVHLCLCI